MKANATTKKVTAKKVVKKPAAKKVAAKKAVKNPETASTEIVFILDRSGSMGGRETDVIGGFNRMITDQQAKKGECFVSTVLFDDKSEVLHDRVPVGEVRPLTEREYNVRGCTAYYDALGRAIRHHIYVQRCLPEEKRAEKVLFVVMTDGEENASREYRGDQLKRLVAEEQEEWGWEFVFIGAGIDALQAAQEIGIKADNAISTLCDAGGIKMSYICACDAITNLRERRAMRQNADGTSFRQKIDLDYARRKQTK